MPADWSKLSTDLQLTLAREALRRAADTIASQAEILAEEIDAGRLQDRGGSDALRLLAAVVRTTSNDTMATQGSA